MECICCFAPEKHRWDPDIDQRPVGSDQRENQNWSFQFTKRGVLSLPLRGIMHKQFMTSLTCNSKGSVSLITWSHKLFLKDLDIYACVYIFRFFYGVCILEWERAALQFWATMAHNLYEPEFAPLKKGIMTRSPCGLGESCVGMPAGSLEHPQGPPHCAHIRLGPPLWGETPGETPGDRRPWTWEQQLLGWGHQEDKVGCWEARCKEPSFNLSTNKNFV